MRSIFSVNKIKFVPFISYVATKNNDTQHQEVDFMKTSFYKTNLHKEVSGKQINDTSYNEIFHKCLNDTMNHNHYVYNIGLNTDTVDFNPHGKCSGGGLYVTNRQNIHKFLHYGPMIGNIIIPDDARCYLEEDRFKCDKLILEFTEQIKEHDIFRYMTNDIDYCIQMVKTNSCLIKYIDKHILENNVIICIEAVKKCGFSIQYIDDDILRNNINICFEAVKSVGNSIKYIDKQILSNNVQICVEAVKQNGEAIQYVSNDILFDNIDICVEAIKQNKLNMSYIDDVVIQSSDLLKILCNK